MGPRTLPRCNTAERSGWGRRIRTPATWSRATRPTTRRSPKIPRRRANYSIRSKASQRTEVQRTRTSEPLSNDRGLPNRALQRATGAEARNLGRRDLDLVARARVAAVASGTPGDDEGAEAADGDPPAPAERLVDPAHEGGHRLLGGGLGAARALGHDGDEISLRHRLSLCSRPRDDSGDLDATRGTPTLSIRRRRGARGREIPPGGTASRARSRRPISGTPRPRCWRCRP